MLETERQREDGAGTKGWRNDDDDVWMCEVGIRGGGGGGGGGGGARCGAMELLAQGNWLSCSFVTDTKRKLNICSPAPAWAAERARDAELDFKPAERRKGAE